MLLKDSRHGSEAGHEQHMRDNETPCPPCREAKLRASRRRSKRKQQGHRYTVPTGDLTRRLEDWRAAGATYGEIADHLGIVESRVWEIINDAPERIYTRTAVAIVSADGMPVTTVGVTRRIQALTWMGYSANRIADAAGCHLDTIRDARHEPRTFLARKVRDGVARAYEELHMHAATATTQQERAGVTRSANMARRNGWAAPMAWECIDDQRETPMWGADGRRRNLLQGWRELEAAGESIELAAVRLGVTVGAIERAMFRAFKKGNAA